MFAYVVIKECTDYDNCGNSILAVMSDETQAHQFGKTAHHIIETVEKPAADYRVVVEKIKMDDTAAVKLDSSASQPVYDRKTWEIVLNMPVRKQQLQRCPCTACQSSAV